MRQLTELYDIDLSITNKNVNLSKSHITWLGLRQGDAFHSINSLWGQSTDYQRILHTTGQRIGGSEVYVFGNMNNRVAVDLRRHWCRLKVRLHGTRQAARLARDMLRGNSVYMVGSCRARLLHIIHVSTGVGSSKKTEATARDSMCRAAIISSNLNCRPGSQQSRVCCVQRVAV